MEKLNKEDIYINLQGKSEEELTELEQITGLSNLHQWNYIHFDTYNNYNKWVQFDYLTTIENKQEVTIQQLKEILQPMENKEFDLKGYSVEVDNEEQAKQLQELAFKQGFEWYDGNKIKHLDKKVFIFNAFNENRINYGSNHFEDEYVTKEIHFNDIFKETLEQQLEKAKAEVKRIEKEIEDSKIKVGDWVISSLNNCIFKCEFGRLKDDLTKITDQEIINKLNNLIK